jgi:hypothetical protein
MRNLEAIPYEGTGAGGWARFVGRLEEFFYRPKAALSKEDLLEEIQGILPEFKHIASARNLDERI